MERGFYKECSPTRCQQLEAHIKKHRDRTKVTGGKYKYKVHRRRIGGMDVQALAAFYPNAGMPMKFWRCFQYDYIDRGKDKLVETCTDTAEFRVPQTTLNCYKNVSAILQTLRPIKRGRPAAQEREKVSSEILALAGCSMQVQRQGSVRMVSPVQLTPTIAAQATGHDLKVTRQAINNLVYQGKLVGAKKIKGEKAKHLLHVLQEKAYQMPKDYAVTFDDFVRGERARRERASKKLFGKSLSGVDIPSAQRRVFRGGAEIIRRGQPLPEGYMMGTTAKMRALREEEEWRRRTGLKAPRFVVPGAQLL